MAIREASDALAALYEGRAEAALSAPEKANGRLEILLLGDLEDVVIASSLSIACRQVSTPAKLSTLPVLQAYWQRGTQGTGVSRLPGIALRERATACRHPK